VIFIGMTTAFFAMAQGEPGKFAEAKPPATEARGLPGRSSRDEGWWQIGPPAFLGLLVLWLGLAVPGRLSDVMHQIAATLGGAP